MIIEHSCSSVTMLLKLKVEPAILLKVRDARYKSRREQRTMSKKWIITPLFLTILAVAAVACGNGSDETSQSLQGTLDKVIERGRLICGVKVDTPGFGTFDPSTNTREGNDVEFCRAVAAGILGDADAVDFVEATGVNRFELLASGEIDVLIRTTTWTASRDADLNADFVSTTFYDGQGILVKSDSGINNVNDLDGATICTLRGTTTEQNLEDYFSENGLSYTAQFAEENDPLRQAFENDVCTGWTSDKSQLAGQQFALRTDFNIDAIILPETLSKEPLGPLTRDNDSVFHDVVQWIVFGMIIAEEEGIDSTNVSQKAQNPPNNTAARLLGVGFNGGAVSDLNIGRGRISPSFMQNVIEQVGNYGEVYEKTLAQVGLVREGSLNASYLEGGLIYAPPMR